MIYSSDKFMFREIMVKVEDLLKEMVDEVGK